VGVGFLVKARYEGVEVGVGPDLGGVEEKLIPPHQRRLLAEVDDPLEESLKDADPEPLADAGQAGVVGEVLVERVAEVGMGRTSE